MWAGGALRFLAPLPLDRGWATCAERVVDVRVRPAGPDRARGDMVFVVLERRVGRAVEGESDEAARARLALDGGPDGAAVVERRELVFLPEAASDGTARPATPGDKPRAAPPLPSPSFSHTLVPTPALLFRYSALTFNAHAIHLDAAHAQGREGHRGLLVHGPLTATLLATMLVGRAGAGGAAVRIDELEYRNVAPLYACEPMTLCGREGARPGEFKLWIEGPSGLAVRASAKLADGG
jgi:hydroxyacyl-ACP dehydratase HTD2-like protein with hotdog domain